MAARPFTALRSAVDGSVNYSRPVPGGGMEEARFVQRVAERFIVYISSMAGCDKACRFCHLTQTGQVRADCVTAEAMLEQAETVLDGGGWGGARTVHFNFMARGEPMSNPHVGRALFRSLAALAAGRGLECRIKVSTIMPSDMGWREPSSLWEEGCPPVDIYYSLYSVDPAWRRRWIPKAMDPDAALSWLARWQDETGSRVVLHWALIDGENDGEAGAQACAAAARRHGLDFGFNLVRYNPPGSRTREASGAARAAVLAAMSGSAPERARAIPRVGFDVAASCGMFLEG